MAQLAKIREGVVSQSWQDLTRAMADTTKAFKDQQEGIHLSLEKLSKSEKLADSMVGKILTLTSNLDELDGKLKHSGTAIAKKRIVCDDLQKVIECSKKRLHRSVEESKWMEFHTNEMDTRLSANAFAMKKYDEERRKYQQHLHRVLSECHDVRHKLEDADEGVHYIEDLRNSLEENHKKDIVTLREVIKDTIKAKNSMMSTKSDAMQTIVKNLLPAESDYKQMNAETEDLKNKGVLLKMQLREQSKEMVYLHSKNSELSVKISNLSSKISKAREEKTKGSRDVPHTHLWNRNPLTWFEAPKSDVEKVKDFLVKKHGQEAEARIVQYMDVKTALDSRWLIQMFQKDFVEYEKTLEILSMFSPRKHASTPSSISSSVDQDVFQSSVGPECDQLNDCEDAFSEI